MRHHLVSIAVVTKSTPLHVMPCSPTGPQSLPKPPGIPCQPQLIRWTSTSMHQGNFLEGELNLQAYRVCQWCEQFSRYAWAREVVPAGRIGVPDAGMGVASANPSWIRHGFRWVTARFVQFEQGLQSPGIFSQGPVQPIPAKSRCSTRSRNALSLTLAIGKRSKASRAAWCRANRVPPPAQNMGINPRPSRWHLYSQKLFTPLCY